MLWLANLGLAAGEGSTPTVETPASKGRSRPTVRYVVEIDGTKVAVSSITEAEALLAQARDLAKESAPKDVRRAVRIKPPRIAVKTASGNQTTSAVLTRAVRDTQKAVNAIYRSAAKNIEAEREISRLLQKKLKEEDDEEAILALLL